MTTSVQYLLLSVASAVLSQLAVELGRGNVPIPAGYEWTVSLLSAGIVALTARLPKVGRDDGE